MPNGLKKILEIAGQHEAVSEIMLRNKPKCVGRIIYGSTLEECSITLQGPDEGPNTAQRWLNFSIPEIMQLARWAIGELEVITDETISDTPA